MSETMTIDGVTVERLASSVNTVKMERPTCFVVTYGERERARMHTEVQAHAFAAGLALGLRLSGRAPSLEGEDRTERAVPVRQREEIREVLPRQGG
jgi:hypothetical protein